MCERAFARTGPAYCVAQDTRWVLPGVEALKPNGMTPIAASLEAAVKDFAGKEGQTNIIVLLSDGEEDCNGDPCAAAKTVHEAGVELQVNVIGFHVHPKERTQLQCIANAAGGKYFDAANAGELKVVAKEMKGRVTEAAPSPPAASANELSGIWQVKMTGGGNTYEFQWTIRPRQLRRRLAVLVLRCASADAQGQPHQRASRRRTAGPQPVRVAHR